MMVETTIVQSREGMVVSVSVLFASRVAAVHGTVGLAETVLSGSSA
jgi:uncharacterized membrane protein